MRTRRTPSSHPNLPAMRHRGWKRRAVSTLAGGLAMLLLASVVNAGAVQGDGPGDAAESFVAVRTDRGGDIRPAELDRVLTGLSGVPHLQQVVVLIHGWDTPLYASRKQYARIASEVRAAFSGRGLQVGVVGVQWPSDTGPQRSWGPGIVAHRLLGLLGFPHAVGDAYNRKVPLARATGRQGLRRLLFAIRDRFPEARLHLFSHSMGAEAAIHAIHPYATPFRGEAHAIFDPERMVEVDIAAFAGADVDYDVAFHWRAPGSPEAGARPKLWWITIPNPEQTSGRDRVLVLRKVASGGRQAVGNAVPRLRADQIDRLVGGRSLIFDTGPIPHNHDILGYYSRERVASLVGAAAELQEPAGHASPLLETLARVLAGPDDRDSLQPYLETGVPTVTLYALWRLEHRCCGSSRHIEDGYLLKVERLARTHPAQFQRERAASPCGLVRDGIWPASPTHRPSPNGAGPSNSRLREIRSESNLRCEIKAPSDEMRLGKQP